MVRILQTSLHFPASKRGCLKTNHIADLAHHPHSYCHSRNTIMATSQKQSGHAAHWHGESLKLMLWDRRGIINRSPSTTSRKKWPHKVQSFNLETSTVASASTKEKEMLAFLSSSIEDGPFYFSADRPTIGHLKRDNVSENSGSSCLIMTFDLFTNRSIHV